MAETNTSVVDTALVPKTESRTPAIITTPEEFRDALARWQGHYNILTPFHNISGLAASHGIVVSSVRINSDATKGGPGEVYDGLPFLKKDEVAIAKIGLRKIADCGGISTETIRTDPRTLPHYWEMKAIARYRGIDGSIVQREATVEWDLRDGSDRLKGWTANQVSEGRKNGLRNCEARAINAAIRECGIKQAYHRRELEKPFLVLRVAFQPDLSDPETKRLVTEQALRGTSALYPTREAGLPAGGQIIDADADLVDERREPRHVGSGSSVAGTSTAAATTETADPNRPPVDGAVRIDKVEPKSGTGKNGKPYTRYIIVDSNGVEHSTFSKSVADDAAMYRDDRAWVEIREEGDGNYTNLTGIVVAGSEPKLPGMDNL